MSLTRARTMNKISNFLWNFLPSFQFNVLQQSSHVPTVENVSDPLGYAMVIMTVRIIPMKETAQVKCSLALHNLAAHRFVCPCLVFMWSFKTWMFWLKSYFFWNSLYIFLVDCVVSQWSSCSKTCGPGTQQRSVQITAKDGGQKCPSQLTKSCSLKNCPG